MSKLSRRRFLGQTTRVAAASLLAPAWFVAPAEGRPLGGELLGDLRFLGEGPRPSLEPHGTGLAARLALDLSRLDDDHLLTPSDRFYVRTAVPDGLPPTAAWSVALAGLAGADRRIGIEEIRHRSVDQGIHLLECAGNGRHRRFGLLSAAGWRGLPVADLLESAPPRPGLTRILIDGNDAHSREPAGSTLGAGWIFTAAQLADAGAFLAIEMNGAPLPVDHGFPVRLVVPGWYGCCAAKWVQSIEWVPEDVPATSQMREYAGRTHQGGVPAMARDYRPAEIDLAAMPIRVEMWRRGNDRMCTVIGITWGGQRITDRLEIRFRRDPESRDPWSRVDHQDRRSTRTWSLWSHSWLAEPGRYEIELRVDDPSIPTRRLESGYYTRTVEVPRYDRP